MTWNERVIEIFRQILKAGLGMLRVFSHLTAVLARKLDEAIAELEQQVEAKT